MASREAMAAASAALLGWHTHDRNTTPPSLTWQLPPRHPRRKRRVAQAPPAERRAASARCSISQAWPRRKQGAERGAKHCGPWAGSTGPGRSPWFPAYPADGEGAGDPACAPHPQHCAASPVGAQYLGATRPTGRGSGLWGLESQAEPGESTSAQRGPRT